MTEHEVREEKIVEHRREENEQLAHRPLVFHNKIAVLPIGAVQQLIIDRIQAKPLDHLLVALLKTGNMQRHLMMPHIAQRIEQRLGVGVAVSNHLIGCPQRHQRRYSLC